MRPVELADGLWRGGDRLQWQLSGVGPDLCSRPRAVAIRGIQALHQFCLPLQLSILVVGLWEYPWRS
jgi:hypothetical protein